MIAHTSIVTALLQAETIPPQVVDIATGFFLMITAIALGVPLIRVFARRLERGQVTPTLPAELTTRLDRIEQGVEAMAIEIERISEGQRFTTKLLAEQQRALANPDVASSKSRSADASS